MEVYCKCGCGKLLSQKKVKRGGMFLNRAHASAYRGRMRRGIKLGPYNKIKQDAFNREVDYDLGKNYCIKYNNDDIKCVVCYEQNLRRECFEK